MTLLLKPLHLLQHEEGKVSFFFMSDAFYHAPIMDTLRQKTGIDRDYFNGYAWARVISKLIEVEFRDNAAEIQLDPESDMFSTVSADYALILRLALRFQALMKDEKALVNLLDQADVG